MLRGMTKFVCDDCGHKFKGMDCELWATAYTAPVRCPQCGSWHTMPAGWFSDKSFYKDIWKRMDEYRDNTEKQ